MNEYLANNSTKFRVKITNANTVPTGIQVTINYTVGMSVSPLFTYTTK